MMKMTKLVSAVLGSCLCAIGCGSSTADNAPGGGIALGGATAGGGAFGAGGLVTPASGGAPVGAGGVQSGGAPATGNGGLVNVGGGGAPAIGSGGVNVGAGGLGSGGVPQGAGGSNTGGTAAGTCGTGASGGTNVTGSLGTTPLNPIVTALVSANAGLGETIIYMFTSAVTCAQISTPGWLPSIAASTQVVEMVIVPATSTPGTFPVPNSEVNYANGGQLSLFETSANSGSITVTQISPGGVIEGSVSASYTGGSISGTFHAEFCATGQAF